MGLVGTSVGLAVCLAVLAAAIILDHRPYRPGRRNYILVMVIALAAGLVLGRHLLALLL
jgi:VanZ family protein